MNLPRADALDVPREKITDYLLNPLHPDGAGKAIFFRNQGFQPDSWQILADALRVLAGRFPVAKETQTKHGVKYVVEGALESPSGKTPTVRTVWIIDQGNDTPRFVTAYPLEEGE